MTAKSTLIFFLLIFTIGCDDRNREPECDLFNESHDEAIALTNKSLVKEKCTGTKKECEGFEDQCKGFHFDVECDPTMKKQIQDKITCYFCKSQRCCPVEGIQEGVVYSSRNFINECKLNNKEFCDNCNIKVMLYQTWVREFKAVEGGAKLHTTVYFRPIVYIRNKRCSEDEWRKIQDCSDAFDKRFSDIHEAIADAVK